MRWRPKVHHIARSAQAWQEKPVCRDLGRLGCVLRDVTRSPPDVFLRDVDNLELPAPANATAVGRHLHRVARRRDGAVASQGGIAIRGLMLLPLPVVSGFILVSWSSESKLSSAPISSPELSLFGLRGILLASH